MIVLWGLCFRVNAQVPPPVKPRVLISTDIGGTDPDDNQSMAHLLMYSDYFQLEGLVSSPSFGEGSKAEILRMISLYEKDYPKLKAHYPGLMSPDELRPLCKQGRKGMPGYVGYGTSTEGSEWIVQCARRECEQPLWVLVWGGLEDLAQALHDAPDILSRIRVYWIGGPNKKWGVDSYTYIAEHFPDLWIIENNASYRGFISDGQNPDRYNRAYYDQVIKGAGALGEDFINYYKGLVKMGDSPSLFYLMNGDPYDPVEASWGGRFEPMKSSPRVIFDRHATPQDTVPVYAVVEFRFPGPYVDLPEGAPCFTMTIDRQTWTGYYGGDGTYRVRYAPKAPAVLSYTLASSLPELDGGKGILVVGPSWPGNGSADSFPLGEHWYTDCQDPQLFEGIWQGSRTVSQWRKEILEDWAVRWEVLK